jgi:hypothetical protein
MAAQVIAGSHPNRRDFASISALSAHSEAHFGSKGALFRVNCYMAHTKAMEGLIHTCIPAGNWSTGCCDCCAAPVSISIVVFNDFGFFFCHLRPDSIVRSDREDADSAAWREYQYQT